LSPSDRRLDEEDAVRAALAYRVFEQDNIRRPCMDLDCIVFDAAYQPRALLETTHCDTTPDNPNFYEQVDARINGSFQQGTALRVAALLGVRAYLVTFRLDCDRFGVRHLEPGSTWHFTDRQGYIDWHHSL